MFFVCPDFRGFIQPKYVLFTGCKFMSSWSSPFSVAALLVLWQNILAIVMLTRMIVQYSCFLLRNRRKNRSTARGVFSAATNGSSLFPVHWDRRMFSTGISCHTDTNCFQRTRIVLLFCGSEFLRGQLSERGHLTGRCEPSTKLFLPQFTPRKSSYIVVPWNLLLSVMLTRSHQNKHKTAPTHCEMKGSIHSRW